MFVDAYARTNILDHDKCDMDYLIIGYALMLQFKLKNFMTKNGG